MGLLDQIKSFANSDEGSAFAQALLANSGLSPRRISLGEAVGQGLLGIDKTKQRQFENQQKSALLDLRREGLDLQRMSTEASIQNMQQQRAEAYQRLKMMMDDRAKAREQEAQQKQYLQQIQNAIGMPGEEIQTPATPGIPYSPGGGWSPANLPTPASTEVRGGSGLLGGKVNDKEFKAAVAKSLVGMGDIKSAFGLLNPKPEKFSAPREVIDPATGQPILAQISEGGTVRPVQGALPAQKKGTELTVDPKTGQVTFSQGGSVESLGKPAINEIEKRMVINEDLIKGVQSAQNLYDRDFLTLYGKGKKALINAADYLNAPLTQDQASFPGRSVNFEHEVGRTLHRYMQSVIGSRGGIRMLEQMEKSFPNMKLKPNEMVWALENIKKNLKESQKTLNELRKTGKFTEEQIKEKVDDQAMKDMERIINKAVDNGSKVTQEFKRLDIGKDRLGLGSYDR